MGEGDWKRWGCVNPGVGDEGDLGRGWMVGGWMVRTAAIAKKEIKQEGKGWA